jgi:hypothetical protein
MKKYVHNSFGGENYLSRVYVFQGLNLESHLKGQNGNPLSPHTHEQHISPL